MSEETLTLHTVAPPIRGSGLQQTVGYLRAIEASLGRIGNTMAGVITPPDPKMVRRMVDSLGKDLSLSKLAQQFDIIDPKLMERGLDRYAAQFEKQYKQKMSKVVRGLQYGKGLMPSGEFVAPGYAAAAMEEVLKLHKLDKAKGVRAALGGMGGHPPGGTVPVPTHEQAVAMGKQFHLTSPVRLEIRGDQVVAHLVTPPPVMLPVPGSAVSAQPAPWNGIQGAAPGKAKGRGGGAGGGSAGGGGGSGGPQPLPSGKNVTRTTSRTNADGDTYDEVTQALSPFRSRTTRQTRDGNSSRETDRLAASVRSEANELLRDELNLVRQRKASLKGSRNKAMVARGMARVYEATAGRLEGELAGTLGQRLSDTGQDDVRNAMRRRIDTLRASADAERQVAGVINAERQNRAADLRRQRQQGQAAEQARQRSAAADAEYAQLRAEANRELRQLKKRQAGLRAMGFADRARLADDFGNASAGMMLRYGQARSSFSPAQTELLRGLHAQAQQAEARLRASLVPPQLKPAAVGGPPPKLKRHEEPQSILNTGLQKAAKVTGWAAIAVPAYQAIDAVYTLLGSALPRMTELSAQTARLGQVFRGVGGSAREVAADVLGLAVAEGQSSQKAMESAISWSRLGLSRKQVGEAVRVSLQAANVAELDSLEATQQLQAVMMAYGLRVDELAGLLGKLNSVSNTLNVTNAELFSGLSKSASVARQVGMPIETLVGMIGAGAASGQTGAQMGNALKTFMVRLMDPVRQERLSKELGFEVRTETGMKSGSKIFAELSGRWQGMSGQERGRLQNLVAGATQGNRLAIALESYTTAAVQAVNAGLNLQSAEKEDAKIKAEAKSRIVAVTTAWDKMLTSMDGTLHITESVATALQGLILGLGGLGEWIGSAGIPFIGKARNTPAGRRSMVRLVTGGLGDAVHWGEALGSASDAWIENRTKALGERLRSTFGAAANTFRNGSSGATAISSLETLRSRAGSMRSAAELLRAQAAAPPLPGRVEEVIKKLAELSPDVIGKKDVFTAQMTQAAREGKWAARLAPYYERAEASESDAEGRAKALYEFTLADLEKRRDAYPQGNDRRKEIEAEINALIAKRRVMEDESAFNQEAVSAALERTREIVRITAERYRGLVASGGQRLEIEKRVLEAQLAAVRAEESRAPARSDYRSAVGQQADELQARLDALSMPRVAGSDAMARALQVATEIAKVEAESLVRGDSEIARLRSQESILQRMITQKKAIADGATRALERETATAQVLALQQSLEETRTAQIRLRVAATREEEERRRSTLTAGPDEIFRRAFARRLAGRQMSSGQFFSLGPGMRQEVLEEQRSAERQRFLRAPLNVETEQRRLLGEPGFRTAAAEAAAAAAELWEFRRSTGEASSATRELSAAASEAAAVLRRIGGGTTPGGAPRVAQDPNR